MLRNTLSTYMGCYIRTHNIEGVRNDIVGTRLKPDLRRTERPGTETTQRTGTRTFSKKKLCRGRPSTVTIHTFAEADVGRGAGTARTSASRGSLVETCASKFPNFNLWVNLCDLSWFSQSRDSLGVFYLSVYSTLCIRYTMNRTKINIMNFLSSNDAYKRA